MADISDSVSPDKEATPLSQEGNTAQLELEIKPKAAEKTTNVTWKDKTDIKKIMATPKESGSSDAIDASTASSTNIPKPDKAEILSRLNSSDASSGKVDPPTPDESNDTAGMIIDGFNGLFLFFVSIWSKDPDPSNYQVDTVEKNKLKKYLSAIFFKAEKKINPIWLLIGLFIVLYLPMLQKGYKHRKMVEEERAKNKPGTTVLSGEPRRKRRRSSYNKNNNNDEGSEYVHAEVIK